MHCHANSIYLHFFLGCLNIALLVQCQFLPRVVAAMLSYYNGQRVSRKTSVVVMHFQPELSGMFNLDCKIYTVGKILVDSAVKLFY